MKRSGPPARKSPLRRTGALGRTSAPKSRRKPLTALQRAARGRPCQVRLPGHCTGDESTVVLAHLPGGGMAAKMHDIHGAHACFACHQVLDGHANSELTREEIRLFHYEGVIRTQVTLLQEGAIQC